MEIVIKKEILLDDYLRLYKLTPSTIYKLKYENKIKINNIEVKINTNPLLKVNDTLMIEEENVVQKINYKKSINIIYENEFLIICDKPHDMLVHSDGNTNETLINYLANQIDVATLKVIHRIDYETRGLIIFSKNILGHSFLNYQMQNNLIEKKYMCYVWGKMKLSSNYVKLENYIGKNRHENNKYIVVKNKEANAITLYKPIKYSKINDMDVTIVEAKIITGKTHQIRVHMSYLNHPIVNDKIYGKEVNGNLKLYNVGLKFTDPLDFKDKEITLWIE